MAVCISPKQSLPPKSSKGILESAPSVPTHRPANVLDKHDCLYSDQVRHETPGVMSLSAQTTSDTSSQGDPTLGSSSAPSKAESTSASSISQASQTASLLLSTSSNIACHPQAPLGIRTEGLESSKLRTQRERLSQSQPIAQNLKTVVKDANRIPLRARHLPSHVEARSSRCEINELNLLSNTTDASFSSSSKVATQGYDADVETNTLYTQTLTRVLKGRHPLFRYKQKAYILPSMAVSQVILDRWESHVKERLEDAICQTLRDSQTGDGGVTIDCLMAGPTKSDLRPTVVVACHTESLRRTLIKKIKNFVWISESELEWLVIFSPTAMLSTSTADIVGIAIGGGSMLLIVVVLGVMAVVDFRRRHEWRSQSQQGFVGESVLPAAETLAEAERRREERIPSWTTRRVTFHNLSDISRPGIDDITELPSNPISNEINSIFTNRRNETAPIVMNPYQKYLKMMDTKASIIVCNDLTPFIAKYRTILRTNSLRELTCKTGSCISTLGGLIVIDGNVFALTVAHTFQHNNEDHDRKDTEYLSPSYRKAYRCSKNDDTSQSLDHTGDNSMLQDCPFPFESDSNWEGRVSEDAYLLPRKFVISMVSTCFVLGA